MNENEKPEFSILSIAVALFFQRLQKRRARRLMEKMNYTTPAWDELKRRGYTVDRYKGGFCVYNEYGRRCGPVFSTYDDRMHNIESFAQLELERIGDG